MTLTVKVIFIPLILLDARYIILFYSNISILKINKKSKQHSTSFTIAISPHQTFHYFVEDKGDSLQLKQEFSIYMFSIYTIILVYNGHTILQG